MMVPRAYSYSSTSSRPSTSKSSHRQAAPSPIPPDLVVRDGARGGKKVTPASRLPSMATISAATPSQPVVIPTRTRLGRGHTNRETETKSAQTRQPVDSHDAHALPPSVAAFLAVTTIPSPRSNPGSQINSVAARLRKASNGPSSLDGRTDRTPLSNSNPQSWGVLLSPPDEIGDAAVNQLSSIRSLSSDSMPSLDADSESVSSISSPPTPGWMSRSRSYGDRKFKSIPSSVKEDCHLDHPLLPIDSDQNGELDSSSDDQESEDARLVIPSQPSFKSNLTASFRRLKSAALSLSNFTGPLAPRESTPARPLLSNTSQFTDERRPLPWAEPPDPALRRYLNPITISPVDLHEHRVHDESPLTRRNCTASIQMQTYRRDARKSKKASSPPVFAPNVTANAVDEQSTALTPRQREPRENSDFLRVIVLEMNMRRTGKLGDSAPGRAQLWLPARDNAKQPDERSSETPRRWVPMTV